jgi:hypothetical protein
VEQAFMAAQAEMPGLQKDKVNPHFGHGYVTLQSLMGVVLPILHKHGLSLRQTPTVILHEGAPPQAGLLTRLTHAGSGEFVQDTMPLMADRANPQGQGSAITYARRYALMSMLGLVADEDDDGNAASPKGGGRVVENADNASTTPAQSGAGVKF